MLIGKMEYLMKILLNMLKVLSDFGKKDESKKFFLRALDLLLLINKELMNV